MDVIINTGANYYMEEQSLLWKILELIVPALLSLAAAWAVAWWVFVRERRNERNRQTADLQSLREHYVALLDGLRKPIEQHITNIKELVDALAKNENRDIHFEMVASLDFRRLNLLDETLLFRAMVLSGREDKDKRNEAYTTICRQIDYFEKVKEGHAESFTEFGLRRRQYEEQWGASMDGIMHHLNAWVGENIAGRTPPAADPMLLRIQQLRSGVFGSVKQGDDYSEELDMQRVVLTFIAPLFEALNSFPQDPRTTVLSQFAMACRQASGNLGYLRKVEREHFALSIERMEDARTKLFNALEVLRKP